MYKKCAQAANNPLEKSVHELPQNPRLAVARNTIRNVVRTIHRFLQNLPRLQSQLVHRNFVQNNRSIQPVIRSFHTTYYYYY